MKPLGHKAYGSIPHLPGSKRGPGDHGLNPQQAALLTGERPLPKGAAVYVQEKLDGSCMSVAKIDGKIIALGRAGFLAESSPHEHCRLFAPWVAERAHRFDRLLNEGERVVGEWMLMATAIRYWIADPEQLFITFDIMRGHERVPPNDVRDRCYATSIRPAQTLGEGPIVPQSAWFFACMKPALKSETKPEGVVYRYVVDGKVAFLGKWVRPDFEAGRYLGQDVYNYPPQWLRGETEAA